MPPGPHPRLPALLLLLASASLASSQAPATPAAITLRVTVTLSPAAAARLAPREGIIAFASLEADPAPGAEKHADRLGHIDLGSRKVEIPGRPGDALLQVSTATVPLRWTRGPILLNINLFSARHTSSDNLLACDFFDGPLPHALGHPVPLHCSLITENQPTRALN